MVSYEIDGNNMPEPPAVGGMAVIPIAGSAVKPMAVSASYGTDFYTKPLLNYPPITLTVHDIVKGVVYGALSHAVLRFAHSEKTVKNMALGGYILGASFSGVEKIIDGAVLGGYYGSPDYGGDDPNYLPQAVFQSFVVSGGISATVNALITYLSKRRR